MGDYRHPVGKETLQGTILVRAREQKFFGPDPGAEGRVLELLFGAEQIVAARYYRTPGDKSKLKITYTGKAGEGFRRFLRRAFPTQHKRKPRGVLIFVDLGSNRFQVRTESVREARQIEKLKIGEEKYFEGAKGVRILHPAMLDLKDLIHSITITRDTSPEELGQRIAEVLSAKHWQAAASVGEGLSLSGGLRRSGAQLHPVFLAQEFYPALLSLAAAFHFGVVDLGVILVADGILAQRLSHASRARAASLNRAIREAIHLPFLVRGPLCVIGLVSAQAWS